MVFDKDTDGKAPESADAPPPSYQAAISGSPSTSRSAAADSSSSKKSPYSSGSNATKALPTSGNASPLKKSAFFRAVSSVFDGPTKQVRATTQALVRDIVQRAPEAPSLSLEEAEGVLESCAAACTARGVELGSILRESFIEQHMPVYWAIIAGNASLAQSLLERSEPLTSSVAGEVRTSCTLVSDDKLWRRLRDQYRALDPSPTASEAMILAGRRDEVEVTSTDDTFAVGIRIPHFQKRMRVAGQVAIEHIAHGRLFKLSFRVNTDRFGHPKSHDHPDGAWLVALSLLPPSAPTHVYARLKIDPRDPAQSPESTKKQQPLVVNMSSSYEELSADPYSSTWRLEAKAPLPSGALQGDNSKYLDTEGTLHARVDTSFQKPSNTDCIIC